MAAYIIVNVDVLDARRYPEYTTQVPATLAAYGGRFIVRGGAAERLEGTTEPKRMVVIEFADVAAARAWWQSAEYAGPKALRQAIAKADIILVEGV